LWYGAFSHNGLCQRSMVREPFSVLTAKWLPHSSGMMLGGQYE
jgi:hypothetical protein